MSIINETKEILIYINKKHLKNVGPIRHNEPPYAHSPDVASGTVARRLRIDVHDNDDNDDNDNDNAWQSGPLWPHGMGPNHSNTCSVIIYYVIKRTEHTADGITMHDTNYSRMPSRSQGCDNFSNIFLQWPMTSTFKFDFKSVNQHAK